MKLNVAAVWTMYVSVLALVALTATTLTAAGSDRWALAAAGLAGMAGVLVIGSSIVAATLLHDRKSARKASAGADIAHLPVRAHPGIHRAA